ncbi:MAG: carboxylating nicotinate-nucleotide diphosphorylase [Marinobacter sp.]|uniref:carboxylating nicotinate-nucleotide diphosphorylase n=1 Tax=Marinobacter sp. TaxID=50741 RepID=UPI00299F31AC|nr:carboxylating nicotinate-nucleotide diphosphorylase [Marinobacter sp.]MDX1757462.1 carboxylating nicotinate-nucleotide diphosphorylase [Marinobacter sp.]
MIPPELLRQSLVETVAQSLREDVGSGDITAALIPEERVTSGQVITRETAVIAGQHWVNEVFRQVDPGVQVQWHVRDGDRVQPNQVLFSCEGRARSLLTAERAALNWLQSLSGVATTCHHYAQLVAHTGVKLLDTRKTLPGLRLAQKYAVTCGGCFNHRLGLWDAFLIKENHIAACGSIAQAVQAAHQLAPGRPVEVETETMDELKEALAAGADTIMLDEFSLEDMRAAVALANGTSKLEASGGINAETLIKVAETGVDYISIGALTKDIKAIDLSMRLNAF